MKLIRVKTKDVKKCDLKPSQRIKVSGNVFVEVYKDNKGYFYRIDIPGATDFVSKERYPNPDKASLAGRTHAQKFMKKIKGDEKKGDAKKCDNGYDTLLEGLETLLSLSLTKQALAGLSTEELKSLEFRVNFAVKNAKILLPLIQQQIKKSEV